MNIKKVFFSLFIALILVMGVIAPAYALGVPNKEAKSPKALPINPPSDDVKKVDIIKKQAKKSKKTLKQEDPVPMAPGFFHNNLYLSGYVERPNGDPVVGATITLGTPMGSPPAPYCALTISNESQTTTDVSGYYEFNPASFGTVTSGADTCNLDLIISNSGYIGTNTTIVINNVTDTYPGTNETILQHAVITAEITTNLMYEPNTSYGQSYDASVIVNNTGDIAANSINVVLTSEHNSSIIPVSNPLGTINGLSAKTAVFNVTSPSVTLTETLNTTVTGTDADDGSALTANDSINIFVYSPAGGTNRSLVLSNFTLTPNLINAQGMLTSGTINVTNNGETTAENVVLPYEIHEGTNCSGTDVSSSFVLLPNNAVNLTAGETKPFTIGVSTLTAPSNNYTVCATASATDANDGTPVGSNPENNSNSFEVDADAPVLNDIKPIDNTVTGDTIVQFSFEATDDHISSDYTLTVSAGNSSGPVANVIGDTLYVSENYTFATDGIYTWFITVNDTVGNQVTSSVMNLTIDNSPPVITITSPAGGSSGPSAFLNATTNKASTCNFGNTTNPVDPMNLTGGTSHSQELTGLASGAHTYYVNCTDDFGNTAEENITWTVDTTAPILTIVSPLNQSYGYGWVWANVTGNEALSQCDFKVDDWVVGTMSNSTPTDYYFNVTGVSDGVHTMSFYCTDLYGNSATTTNVIFTMDLTGPEISLTTPIFGFLEPVIGGVDPKATPGGGINPQSIHIKAKPGSGINFTFTDVNSVSTHSWELLNGSTIVDSDSGVYSGTSQTESLFIDTSTWVDGNYTFNINATDGFGNLNSNVTGFNDTNIEIIVDSVDPNLTVIEPVNLSWHGSSVFVSATATDDTGIAILHARWENTTNASDVGAWVELSLANGSWTGSVNSTNLSEDNWTIKVRALDISGNNDTEDRTVQIDRTAPAVLITDPAAGSTVTIARGVSLTVNVTDTGIGIDPNATCTVFISGINLGTIVYNENSGVCTGAVTAPSVSVGTKTLEVTITDLLGHIGSDNISVEMVPPPPGGGGGGGGSPATNETVEEEAETLNFEMSLAPDSTELLSDESITITIEIENTGEGILNNLKVKTFDLDSEDYTVPEEGLGLFPGDSDTIEMTISPASLESGKYRIEIEVGNTLLSRSETFVLTVTNVDEIQARDAAIETCNAAETHIADLAAQDLDTSQLEEALTKARTFIDEGFYENGLNTCNNINEVTPETIGAATAANLVTGLFIGTGTFVAGNVFWLLIGSGLLIGVYLGRRRISEFLLNRVRKGKGPKIPEASKTP